MLELKKIFFIFMLIFLTSAAHATEHKKTIIHDQKEAGLLLGKHLFINSILIGHPAYIIKTRPGTLHITNANQFGIYRLAGYFKTLDYSPCNERKTLFGEDRLQISGVIKEIRSQEFDVEGIIATFSRFGVNHGEKHFQEEGVFTFSRKNNSKYWEIQNIEKYSDAALDNYDRISIFITNEIDEIFDYETATKELLEQCNK